MLRVASHLFSRSCAILLAGAFLLAPLHFAFAQGKTSDTVTKAKVAAGKLDADGNQELTITLTIDKGWHIYANPVPNADFPGVQTNVVVTGKTKPAEVKVEYPKGTLVQDKTVGDHHVYEGTVDVKVKVRRAKGDTEPLTVEVTVQACSKNTCLLQSTFKLDVP